MKPNLLLVVTGVLLLVGPLAAALLVDAANPGFSTQGGLVKLALILSVVTGPCGLFAIAVGLLSRTRFS